VPEAYDYEPGARAAAADGATGPDALTEATCGQALRLFVRYLIEQRGQEVQHLAD
jgi:hypothetical protein